MSKMVKRNKRGNKKKKKQPYYKVESTSKCDQSAGEEAAVRSEVERDQAGPNLDVHQDDRAILRLSVSYCEEMSPSAVNTRIQRALKSELKKLYLSEDELVEILKANSCDRNTFDVCMKNVRGR